MTISIEIGDNGGINVSTREEDSVHRRVIFPGRLEDDEWVDTDLTGEAQEIIDAAAVAWTAEVKAAYESILRANLPTDPGPYQQFKTPTLYAVAQLGITPGDISGIDVNSRFSAALYMDVGLYYIFFAQSQPDTNYLAKAYDEASRVRVSERAQDYIVVEATDYSGVPTDPAEVSIEIIRVG